MALHAGSGTAASSISSSAFPLLAPDGSASAPSYANSTGKTGIYFGSGEVLDFSTNQANAGSISSVGIWAIGPTAGLGTSGAAYSNLYGSFINNVTSAASTGLVGANGAEDISAGAFRDSAGTLKALVTNTGYTYARFIKTSTSTNAIYELHTNYQDAQTANSALVTTNEIIPLQVSGIGKVTLGASGGIQTHVANGLGFRLGDGTTTASIFGSNTTNTSSVQYCGGTSSSNSANITVYGSAHATQADVIQFQNSTLTTGTVSAAGLWTIGASGGVQNHSINGIACLLVGSNSGSDVTYEAKNNSNTASSRGRVAASVAGTSAGAACFQANITGVTSWSAGILGTDGATADFQINAGGLLQGTTYFRVTTTGSTVLNNAAIATNATDGFLYIASCAGTPTGVPTSKTGRVPIVYDSTNNKIYVYNGAWKATAALT